LILSDFIGTTAALLYYTRLVSEEVVIIFGKTVGTMSAVIVFLHYTPQLVVTYKLSKAESLSLPMLLMQCPGAFFGCWISVEYTIPGLVNLGSNVGCGYRTVYIDMFVGMVLY